jgi:hypothetical protein
MEEEFYFSQFIFRNTDAIHEELGKFSYAGVLLVDLDSFQGNVHDCSSFMSVKELRPLKDKLPFDDLCARISKGTTPVCVKSGNRVGVYEINIDKRGTTEMRIDSVETGDR